MSEHTPEPWQVSGIRIKIAGRPFLRVGPDGEDVALVCYSDVKPGEHAASHADAARIVACVNACAGIPTERLEGESVMEALKTLAAIQTHPGAAGSISFMARAALAPFRQESDR